MTETDAPKPRQDRGLHLSGMVAQAPNDLGCFHPSKTWPESNKKLKKRVQWLWQSNQHIESVQRLSSAGYEAFMINREAAVQIVAHRTVITPPPTALPTPSSTECPEQSDEPPGIPEVGIIEELLLDDIEIPHPDVRLPILVPFIVQHHVCLAVQSTMEAVCFDYGQKHIPNLLRERQWDCPEAASLPNWLALFNRCPDDLRLPPGLLSDHARTRSCLTMYEAALARARLPYESLRCGIRDALSTVQALGGLDALPAARAYIQNLCAVARQLRDQMRELDGVAGRHRDRLRDAMEEIAAKRAALDKEEAAARQIARAAMAEYEAKWDAQYKAAFAARDTFCSSGGGDSGPSA